MDQPTKPEHYIDEAKVREACEILKAQVEEHEKYYQEGPEPNFCVTTRSAVVAGLMSFLDLELGDLGIIAEQFLCVEKPDDEEKNAVDNPDMQHSEDEWPEEIPDGTEKR